MESKPYAISNFLHTFYNLSNYYFVSRFHYKQNSWADKVQYSVAKRSCLHLLAMITIQVSICFPFLFEMHRVRTANTATFFSYYVIFMISMCILTILHLLFKLWTNEKIITELLNSLCQIEVGLKRIGAKLPSNAKLRYLSFFLIIFSFLWGVYEGFIIHITHQSVMEFIQVESRDFEFCPQSSTASRIAAVDLPTTCLVVSVLMTLGRMIAVFMMHFRDVFILAHTISFYIIVRQYRNFLEDLETNGSQDDETIENKSKILTIFEQLAELSKVMDKAIGPMVAGMCFGMLPFYIWKAYDTVARIDSSDPFGLQLQNLIQLGFCLFKFGIFLVLAAEANSMLNSLRCWLQNSDAQMKRKFDSFHTRLEFHERVLICLNLLSSNQIGIHGRFFTVTYGFVGNIVGIVMTYSVLMFQLTRKT